MRLSYSLWPLAGFFMLLVSLPLYGIEQGEAYTPVKLVAPLEMTIPPKLKELGMTNPEVRFRVMVGADGELTDFLAVSATHVGLLDRAEQKLQEARFKPALLNGEASTGRITVIVTFFDPEQRAWKQGFAGAPLGGNVSDAVERKLYKASADAYVLHESKPTELDAPLEMLESKLYRLHAPGAQAPSGQVIVEYYIDHTGKVRLPEIIRSDDEYLSLSVIMSLRETRFEAPTKDGRATYVRVRQPFNFD